MTLCVPTVSEKRPGSSWLGGWVYRGAPLGPHEISLDQRQIKVCQRNQAILLQARNKYEHTALSPGSRRGLGLPE